MREALAAGAAGFSTSFSYAHRGVDGKPVPSRFADRAEVDALFRAAGDTGKGVILITPGEQCTYADVYDWQPQVGRPFTYPLFAAPGGKHLEPVGLHDRGLADGADVWPQVTPRPLTMQFTLADPYSLNTGAVFGELLKVGRAVRLAAYRDPAWRALAAADLEHSPMKPRWETFEVSESARFPELQGRRVSELAAERGSGPLDVMCELAVEEDLATRFRAYIANDDVDEVGRLLNHDHVALGLSDAGAHVDQLCDAPLPTDLLGTWVRDRGLMPLERAVRKLTGEPADMFGFARRGYLREGYWADVCVFDPATVAPGPTRRVRDFPADAERLTAEEPVGMRHTLVNGTPIRVDGAQLDFPDHRPGTRPGNGLSLSSGRTPAGRLGHPPEQARQRLIVRVAVRPLRHDLAARGGEVVVAHRPRRAGHRLLQQPVPEVLELRLHLDRGHACRAACASWRAPRSRPAPRASTRCRRRWCPGRTT